MDNILFLDFDGPLTNQRSFWAFDIPHNRDMWTTADPVAIAILNQLSIYFDLKIVISSTWRLTSLTPTGLSAADSLRHWGFTGNIHKDSVTVSSILGDRNSEILDWLSRHQDNVKNYASLDDLPLKKYTNNVLVHPDDGINSQNINQLKGFLSGGGYSIQMLKNKNLI